MTNFQLPLNTPERIEKFFMEITDYNHTEKLPIICRSYLLFIVFPIISKFGRQGWDLNLSECKHIFSSFFHLFYYFSLYEYDLWKTEPVNQIILGVEFHQQNTNPQKTDLPIQTKLFFPLTRDFILENKEVASKTKVYIPFIKILIEDLLSYRTKISKKDLFLKFDHLSYFELISMFEKLSQDDMLKNIDYKALKETETYKEVKKVIAPELMKEDKQLKETEKLRFEIKVSRGIFIHK